MNLYTISLLSYYKVYAAGDSPFEPMIISDDENEEEQKTLPRQPLKQKRTRTVQNKNQLPKQLKQP